MYYKCINYKCHRIHLNRSELNIDSPDLKKKNKKAINAINQKNNDGKCFQYTVTVANKII